MTDPDFYIRSKPQDAEGFQWQNSSEFVNKAPFDQAEPSDNHTKFSQEKNTQDLSAGQSSNATLATLPTASQPAVDQTYADFLTYFSSPQQSQNSEVTAANEQTFPESSNLSRVSPFQQPAQEVYSSTFDKPAYSQHLQPVGAEQAAVPSSLHTPIAPAASAPFPAQNNSYQRTIPSTLSTSYAPPQAQNVTDVEPVHYEQISDINAGAMPSATSLAHPVQTIESGNAVPPDEHEEGELPILEELGIDPNVIAYKALAVMNPLAAIDDENHALSDADLAGPLVVILLIAFMQTIVGKLHYGFLYGLCTLGTLGVHGLLTLIPRKQSPHNHAIMFTASILGYCLIPIAFLSILNIFCTVIHTAASEFLLRWVLTPAAVAWASFCAAKMFVSEGQLTASRAVVIYPMILLYLMVAYAVVY